MNYMNVLSICVKTMTSGFLLYHSASSPNLVSGALKAAHELCANIILCLTVKQKDKQRAAEQSPYNPDQTRCV